MPIPKRFHFLGIPRRRVLFKFDIHGEILKKFVTVDGGIRTHEPKSHGLSTMPFVKVLVGHFKSV